MSGKARRTHRRNTAIDDRCIVLHLFCYFESFYTDLVMVYVCIERGVLNKVSDCNSNKRIKRVSHFNDQLFDQLPELTFKCNAVSGADYKCCVKVATKNVKS